MNKTDLLLYKLIFGSEVKFDICLNEYLNGDDVDEFIENIRYILIRAKVIITSNIVEFNGDGVITWKIKVKRK